MHSTSTRLTHLPRRVDRRAPRSLGSFAVSLAVSLAGPLLCSALVACGAAPKAMPLAVDGNMAHAVYFDLKDERDADALVRDCHTRLAGIPGIRALEVGTRCPEYKTPPRDQTFDVALWVLFEDRPAHDGYQLHPQHRALVQDWTPKLAGLEVFDAWVKR
jgi:hypothetical protein